MSSWKPSETKRSRRSVRPSGFRPFGVETIRAEKKSTRLLVSVSSSSFESERLQRETCLTSA
jgi:hypothetical protein